MDYLKLNKYELDTDEVFRILNVLFGHRRDRQIAKDFNIQIATISVWSKVEKGEERFWRRIYYEYLKRYNAEGECDYSDFNVSQKIDIRKNMSEFDITMLEYDGFENSKKEFKRKLYDIIRRTPTFIIQVRIAYLISLISVK